MNCSISIITVVFNNAQTILNTIQSIKEQQGDEVEHIVVDGGSTDGTLEIIQQAQSGNRILISEPDNGIYDAMNKGIQLATGHIIGFLNSDDVYFDQQILHLVQQTFSRHPEVDIVYGDLVYVLKNDLNKIVRTWKTRTYDDNYFEEGFVPPHPAFFVKRSILVESGGFDTMFMFAADYELMFRLMKIMNSSIIYIPTHLVRMRLGGKTNQSFANILEGNREIMQVWTKHRQKTTLHFWVKRYLKKLKQYF